MFFSFNYQQRGEPINQSRPATPEVGNTEVLHPPSSNQDADQLLSDDLDSPLAPAIQASLEDDEVNFGPVSDDDADNQDSTLPWNPYDFNSMQV